MFEKVTIGSKAPEIFNVVIEIPRGSHNKYEFDEEMEVIKLDRVLYSPFYYPTDYGFIPETRSEDGDHLDALVISSDPLAVGTVVSVRAIGLFKMADEKGTDYKVLGVVEKDPRLAHITSVKDLSAHTPKEIAHFFQTYKTLENKKSEVRGWGTLKEAVSTIQKAQKKWQKELKAKAK